MSLLDLIRIDVVSYLAPDNVAGLPDYFWVLALAVIMIASLIMRWKRPEVEDGGIMDQI